MEARASREHGRLPLPKGEGWGEGLQTIESSLPPHPHPLPVGERESRRAADRVRAHHEGLRRNERNTLSSISLVESGSTRWTGRPRPDAENLRSGTRHAPRQAADAHRHPRPNPFDCAAYLSRFHVPSAVPPIDAGRLQVNWSAE